MSTYQTVEALASRVAELVLTGDYKLDEVTVTVEKPSALAFVERAGVEITRSRAFFEKE
jgi:dihydroneopterin aldolase